MGVRRVFGVLCALALELAGCGNPYPTNGACSTDADCRVCQVCGCIKAYSMADTAGVSCGEISVETSCTKGLTVDCAGGPVSALCVSGQCQAVASMR